MFYDERSTRITSSVRGYMQCCPPHCKQNLDCKFNFNVDVVKDPHAQLEILPDDARRSKHSQLQTFRIRTAQTTLLLAASTSEGMWGWCRAILNRCRFRKRQSPSAGAADVIRKGQLGKALWTLCDTEATRPEEVEELVSALTSVKCQLKAFFHLHFAL